MLIPVIELSLHSRGTYSNLQRLVQGAHGPDPSERCCGTSQPGLREPRRV